MGESLSTVSSCQMFVETFKDSKAGDAYLDDNWKCRMCTKLPAGHVHQPISDAGTRVVRL